MAEYYNISKLTKDTIFQLNRHNYEELKNIIEWYKKATGDEAFMTAWLEEKTKTIKSHLINFSSHVEIMAEGQFIVFSKSKNTNTGFTYKVIDINEFCKNYVEDNKLKDLAKLYTKNIILKEE